MPSILKVRGASYDRASPVARTTITNEDGQTYEIVQLEPMYTFGPAVFLVNGERFEERAKSLDEAVQIVRRWWTDAQISLHPADIGYDFRTRGGSIPMPPYWKLGIAISAQQADELETRCPENTAKYHLRGKVDVPGVGIEFVTSEREEVIQFHVKRISDDRAIIMTSDKGLCAILEAFGWTVEFSPWTGKSAILKWAKS